VTTERIVRILAGTFVLAALALGHPGSPLFVSSGFLLLAAFVGANLLQSGLTRFCPLELVLRRAGVRSATAAQPCADAAGETRSGKVEGAGLAADPFRSV
jgi:hypothetical protein